MPVTRKIPLKHRGKKKGQIGVTRNKLRTRSKTKRSLRKSASLPLVYYREQVLPEFLNLDLSTLKYDGNNYVDAAGRRVSGELHMLIHADLSRNLPVDSFFIDSNRIRRKGNTLEALQSELVEKLLPITEARWRSKGSSRASRTQDYLESLVSEINNFHFETRFMLLSATPTARDLLSRDKRYQGMFAWGSEWIIRTDFSAGISYSPRRDFYGLIAQGLTNGELALLRRCPCRCKTFFVAKDPRTKFLPGHLRVYFDKEHGTERVKNWRKNKDQSLGTKSGW